MSTDWTRSSFHQPTRLGDCVEVWRYGDGVIGVRDARHPDEKALLFGAETWQAFIAGVKAGEFNFGMAAAGADGGHAGVIVCPKSRDGADHCPDWWDGGKCCWCGAEEMRADGS